MKRHFYSSNKTSDLCTIIPKNWTKRIKRKKIININPTTSTLRTLSADCSTMSSSLFPCWNKKISKFSKKRTNKQTKSNTKHKHKTESTVKQICHKPFNFTWNFEEQNQEWIKTIYDLKWYIAIVYQSELHVPFFNYQLDR